MDHNHGMTKEESYADRRHLFKKIWETAMQIDEKDADIMNKPKVIKTLRLDEVDRFGVGKRKKERIRNLRNVCTKILDFCDRQDADDMLYEQMAIDGRGHKSPVRKVEDKPKKIKTNKTKKKIWKAKSMTSPVRDPSQPRATTSERKEQFSNDIGKKTSRNTSPFKIKQVPMIKKYILANKTVKNKQSTRHTPTSGKLQAETNSFRRKVVRKKRSKRKKTSDPHLLETLN